jgi:hypothetical protein
MRRMVHVADMGEIRNLYKVLVVKHKGRKGRPRRGWENNIKMDLKEIGCEDVDWIHLARIGPILV